MAVSRPVDLFSPATRLDTKFRRVCKYDPRPKNTAHRKGVSASPVSNYKPAALKVSSIIHSCRRADTSPRILRVAHSPFGACTNAPHASALHRTSRTAVAQLQVKLKSWDIAPKRHRYRAQPPCRMRCCSYKSQNNLCHQKSYLTKRYLHSNYLPRHIQWQRPHSRQWYAKCKCNNNLRIYLSRCKKAACTLCLLNGKIIWPDKIYSIKRYLHCLQKFIIKNDFTDDLKIPVC